MSKRSCKIVNIFKQLRRLLFDHMLSPPSQSSTRVPSLKATCGEGHAKTEEGQHYLQEIKTRTKNEGAPPFPAPPLPAPRGLPIRLAPPPLDATCGEGHAKIEEGQYCSRGIEVMITINKTKIEMQCTLPRCFSVAAGNKCSPVDPRSHTPGAQMSLVGCLQ